MITTQSLRSLIYRLAWSTPARKGMTVGLTAGLGLIFFIPAMGLAIGGTAFAIWGWVAGAVVALSTYIGGRVGRWFAAKRLP